MTLRSDFRLVKIAAESAYGMTQGTVSAIRCYEPTVTMLNSEQLDRNVIGAFPGTIQSSLLTKPYATIDIPIELAGSGSVAQDYVNVAFAPLIASCGLTVDTTLTDNADKYTLNNLSAIPGCTIEYACDGYKQTIKGCRGTFTITMDANQIPTITFSMTGRYADPTDEGLAAPAAYTNQEFGVPFDSTNTSIGNIFTKNLPVKNFSIDLGNVVNYRDIPNGSTETLVTNRAVTGSVTYEQPVMATFNPFAEALKLGDPTTTFEITHGKTDGNVILMGAPKVKMLEPTMANEDGVQYTTVPFQCVPSAAGNDEFGIEFS